MDGEGREGRGGEMKMGDHCAFLYALVKSVVLMASAWGGGMWIGLCKEVFQALHDVGYRQPTPIQRKTIPSILAGKDVVAMARTGSGRRRRFCFLASNC